jgi:PAS domain S-box-containing protein
MSNATPGLYRHLVDSLACSVAVQDERGRLTYVNGSFAELLGHQVDELLGQELRSFLAADQREEHDAQLERRGEGGSTPYQTVIAGRLGQRLVRLSPQPLFDEAGSFTGTSVTVTTIGDIRRLELESRVMSEIVRAVAVTQNLDELLELIHRSLKRVVFAENFYVALLDDDDESLSFPYFVDQHDEAPGTVPKKGTCTDYILRTGQPFLVGRELFEDLAAEGEVELVGSQSPSWMGVPLKTSDRTIGVMAIQHYEDEDAFSERDLELCASVAGPIALAIEKKRADEKLRESRQLVTSVIESMGDGVVVLDRGFQMIYFSRGLERISRTSRDDILGSGKPAWEHFPHLLEVGAADMMKRAMQGETQSGRELPYNLPDGTTGFTDEIYQPLLDASGEISGVVGVIRDVTSRVTARQELLHKEEQLQHAQKMEAVGRLAGGIAHDFNNLLTAINGFSEILLGELPEDSPQREFAMEIHNAGRRAATLTQKLLALSRKQIVEVRPVELNSLIEKLEPLLQRLCGEHIEIVTKRSSRSLEALLDPSQVEQIVLNLVVNALDAMPSGGRLDIQMLARELDESSAEHELVAGPYVGFEIRDTGIGMSEQTLTQLFVPFFTTKDPSKGTGLGLAIVYGIVKQNDGYVWVDSELGKGTGVQVFFPQRSHQAIPAVNGTDATPRARGSETLLVVEDERGVRLLIRGILERHGYQVLEASNATQALELFGRPETQVDMIIADVVMPQMSGPEMARLLTESDPELKVLFISGHLGETMENQGLIANAELLTKPFTPDALVDKVRSMLDGDGPREGPREEPREG